MVISIVALLISLLLPALGRARAEAQRLMCASQEKKIFMAVALYATDTDGIFPTTMFPNTVVPNIHSKLAEYMPSDEVWTDSSQIGMPEDRGMGGIEVGLVQSTSGAESELVPLYYSFNYWLHSPMSYENGRLVKWAWPFVQGFHGTDQRHVNQVELARSAETLSLFCFHPPLYGWGVFRRWNDYDSKPYGLRTRVPEYAKQWGYEPYDPAWIHGRA